MFHKCVLLQPHPHVFTIFPHCLNSPHFLLLTFSSHSFLVLLAVRSSRAYIYIINMFFVICRPLCSRTRLDMGIVYHKIRCKDMGFAYSLQIFNMFFSFSLVNNRILAKKTEKQAKFWQKKVEKEERYTK